MRIHISAGHTLEGKGTGAEGYINESKENRVLAKKVVDVLKKEGCYVTYGEVNKSANYLKDQVALANKEEYDLVVQIHFNCSDEKEVQKEMGTEVWYGSDRGVKHAEHVCNKLGTLYHSRGIHSQPKFYWLKNTTAPAILIETCFVNSKVDTDKYKANIDKTAKLIAEGILNKSISANTVPVTPPVSPSKPPVRTTQPKYQVIAGTFLERAYAQREVDRLRKLGIDCFVEEEK